MWVCVWVCAPACCSPTHTPLWKLVAPAGMSWEDWRYFAALLSLLLLSLKPIHTVLTSGSSGIASAQAAAQAWPEFLSLMQCQHIPCTIQQPLLPLSLPQAPIVSLNWINLLCSRVNHYESSCLRKETQLHCNPGVKDIKLHNKSLTLLQFSGRIGRIWHIFSMAGTFTVVN